MPEACSEYVSKTGLQQAFRLLPELKATVLKALVFVAAIECGKLMPPYLLKNVIDALSTKATPLEHVLALVGGILAVSVVVTWIEGRYGVFVARYCFKVETDILASAHAKLMELGMAYHEAHPSGDQAQLLNKGASRLRELMWFTFDQFFGASVQLVFTAVVLVWVEPACGMLFLGFLPFVLYRVHRAGQRLQPHRERYHAVFRQASWDMSQSLTNVRTVMDFVQEKREQGHYQGLLDRYLQLGLERIRVENIEHRYRDWVLGLGRFAVLFYAVYLVYNGAMTTGALFLFATLSEKVVSSLFRLGRLHSYLGDSVEAVAQLTAIFEAEPCVTDGAHTRPGSPLAGAIALSQVRFAYRPGQDVLRGISLTIAPRSVIAIVGRSGAGKTSLIKLLCRHYDVTGGGIYMDGVDIRDYPLAELRRQVAVVSQDIQLFDTTVASNIAYGLPAELSDIRRAARSANADDFIMALPDGYQTHVGERGLRLSGGQRQRIGIARALLMRPAILIFDEATSSLDTESERLIQEALSRIAHQQTMILIAHRLSTIEAADRVIVMQDGSVVEAGSPAELIHRGGVFARMRRMQALGELRA